MFKLMSILINVPITLIALTGHELAHAWMSDKLGDPTPRNSGRLTINPLAHLDLIGTILMILTGFGWAKPVMIDPRYYSNTKRDTALVSAAGPLANLVMAVAGFVIYIITAAVCIKTGMGLNFVLNFKNIITIFAARNLCFMVFNLIPIPPLDGSKVLGMFLPDKTYYTMLQYERYFMLLIMALAMGRVFDMIIGTGVNAVLAPMTSMVNRILGLIV